MPKTLASTVDRLMHHAHVCVTSGDSVRLQQATTEKGGSRSLEVHGRTGGRHRAFLNGRWQFAKERATDIASLDRWKP
jgi:hypothetical protein